ncbi:MAG: rod shape-determining protein MreD [Clostridia bacterium]
MKKIISVLGIVIIFLSIYFLQSNFFSWFNIYSIKPNLFMIFVIFLGLFLGKEYGLTFGILLGLILDLFSSQIIGINAISLGAAGLLAGILAKNFSIEHKFTFIIIASLLTFIGESVYYALEIILSEAEVQLIIFIRILLIEIIFNDLIIIIIYPVLNKIGEKLKMMLEDETNYIKYI